MSFPFIITLGVITLIALLMIIVILLQSGQGGGLAGIASSGATRQVLGTRQAPDLLEKITWVLGTAFIVLCILINFMIQNEGPEESIIQQQAPQQQQQMPAAPGGGTDGTSLPGDGGSQQQDQE
jgi:preprotein translocase subunit SecG